MMPSEVAKLLRQPASALPLQLRLGVVTQASPLLVQIGSATTGQPARALTTYTPVLSDVVAVLVQGADRVVLGTVA